MNSAIGSIKNSNQFFKMICLLPKTRLKNTTRKKSNKYFKNI